MNLSFRRKRVSGLLAVVPAGEQSFLEEMQNFAFPEARSRKLMETMGYEKHRVVAPGVCVSDLAVSGLQSLFDRGLLGRDEVDALILVTQSPDHFIPPTANLIQGRLKLKHDVFCLDINQGCAGFVIGLVQAFLLLEQECIGKVVLINADVLSRKTSPRDCTSYPLIGDAASITVIERDTADSRVFANLKMDGTRSDIITIPAGGLRMPATPETAVYEKLGDNNWRAKDHIRTKGLDEFNFVQTEVPPMIASLLAFARISPEDVDHYVFSQPNRFTLQKLADKMKVPRAKMPMSVVETFGNSSSATAPVALASNLAATFMSRRQRVCFAGFGAGLTWASMLLNVGPLRFCEVVAF